MLRNIHSLLLLVIALLMLCCGKGEPERAQTSVKAQQLCAEGRQHLVAREFVKAKVSFKAAIVEAPAEAHGRIGMIAVGVATGDRSLVDESLAALKTLLFTIIYYHTNTIGILLVLYYYYIVNIRMVV